MTVRALDESGDIVTSGGVQFIDGIEEIAQTIRTRLRLFIGEVFRDITDGTPWFETILAKGVTLSSRESALRARIIRTEGVNNIIEMSTDFDIQRRNYTATVTVLTSFGETTITTSEPVSI